MRWSGDISPVTGDTDGATLVMSRAWARASHTTVPTCRVRADALADRGAALPERGDPCAIRAVALHVGPVAWGDSPVV